MCEGPGQPILLWCGPPTHHHLCTVANLAEMKYFILFYLYWFPKGLGLLLDGKKTLFPPFMAVEIFNLTKTLDCFR